MFRKKNVSVYQRLTFVYMKRKVMIRWGCTSRTLTESQEAQNYSDVLGVLLRKLDDQQAHHLADACHPESVCLAARIKTYLGYVGTT